MGCRANIRLIIICLCGVIRNLDSAVRGTVFNEFCASFGFDNNRHLPSLIWSPVLRCRSFFRSSRVFCQKAHHNRDIQLLPQSGLCLLGCLLCSRTHADPRQLVRYDDTNIHVSHFTCLGKGKRSVS